MRFFVCLILLSNTALASFFEERARGWHWYEEGKREEKSETREATQDPVKALSHFKQKVEKAKARAVMAPSFENVLAYMQLQKVLLERSSRFAQKWMEVLYQRPDLDSSLTHPFSGAGQLIKAKEDQRAVESRIRTLSKTHGLFFFFSSSCSYCKAFATIVKGFAQKYGWHVLAISVDGSRLPEFPSAIQNQNVIRKLGVQTLTALLAVHPQSEEIIPLSYGLSTHDQMEERVRVLLLRRSS